MMLMIMFSDVVDSVVHLGNYAKESDCAIRLTLNSHPEVRVLTVVELTASNQSLGIRQLQRPGPL